MMDRKDKREPKALRHQIGQEKCKIYQRSQSSQMAQEATLLPISRVAPSPSATLYRELSLSRLNASKGASQVQERKSQEKLKASGKEEKNSYLVKPRTNTPKYSQGYRIVKLQNSSKLKIQVEQPRKQEEQQPQTQKEQAHFLPVQYYLMEDQTPRALMDRFSIKESGYVLGYSRWYDLNGASSWRKCRVLGFNERVQRWDIEWLHNNRRKEVSRINLYFEGENRSSFDRKVASAHHYRKLSEIYTRYNNQINEISTATHQLSEAQIQRITKKTSRGLVPRLESLVNQLRIFYTRSNHQAQFNATLPFRLEKMKQYKGYLPDCLFQAGQQYKIRYQISSRPLLAVKDIAYFQASRAAFIEKTSLNSSWRLKTLEAINNLEEELRVKSFIAWKPDKPYQIDDLLRSWRERMEALLRVIHHSICEVQHHMGNQLDNLYLDKKSKADLFEASVARYSRFLSMITQRIETLIRKMFISSLKELSHLFLVGFGPEDGLTISITLHKREEKVYLEIHPLEIQNKLHGFIKYMYQQLSTLHCPTKSYISEIRPKNLLRVIDELGQNGAQTRIHEIAQLSAHTYEAISAGVGKLGVFCNQVGEVAQQMTTISGEIRKQMQKKYSFAEIGIVVAQIKQLEARLDKLAKPKAEGGIRISCFEVKVDEVLAKMRRIALEVKRELYKVVFDKIMKDNEKIEKLISGLFERLQKPPSNIIEMLALEKLLREEANEEMEKIYSKIREIPKRIAVLESIDYLDYKDYEACNKVYVMPMKLKLELARVRRELEGTHRKKFGEELNKDATRVLQATRECGESLLGCLKIESLDEMCEKFMQFSNLKDKLQAGVKSAALINERQEAMNWSRTDFSKLYQLRDEFIPHFSLVSYAKGYQIHLELLSVGPFLQIDYSKLQQQLGEATRDLRGIRDIFLKNPKMLRITSEVLDRYSQYSENLPLIKALRNPDLRQRHWLSIRQILVLDPLEESTSLKTLLNSGAKFQLAQLQEVSSIASRELLFEKKLLRLKRDWKEVKFVLTPEGQGLRVVSNLNELRQRVEGDILQVQQILSASFIKFLETQIICWRNQVLYRAYQLLEKWQQVQNEVSLVAAIFGKHKARDQLPGEHIRFQILEKIWRGLLAQTDSQPWLSDILQGKAYDYLNSLENSVSRMKKNLSSFFEDKKREYARLACISDDEFMSLLSCDEKDTRQNAVFEQTVRKCFQNIRTLVRNERHQIIKIRTRSNEEIPFKQMTFVEKLVEYILPNDLIMQLEKKIQRELRCSLESIGESPSLTITQILLLYHRLNFTLSVEEELIANHCISAGYLRRLQLEKEELVSSVLENLPSMKSQSELLQALYHLQTASSLWQHSYLDLYSFAWLSQPRTYLRNEHYQVEVGILVHPYGFEITDLDDVVTEEWSARVFCSIAGAIRERGFCMVEAGPSAGKTASIKKLAALFGHKQFIFDSHPFVSPRNLLEYVRMASSGMWVVLRNLQRLARPQLSLLSRNLQVSWFQSMGQPRQPFSIEGTGITFKVSYLKMFATTERISLANCLLQRGILDYFRVVFLPLMNVEYVVEVKLLVLGLCEVSAGRICAIVEYLRERLAKHSQLSVEFSEIYLVNKLFSFIPKDIAKSTNNQDAAVDRAFIRIVEELVREQSKRNPLKLSLLEVFKIRQEPEIEHNQPYKEEFNSARLYYNQNLVQAYQLLNQLISSRNFMVVIGPPYSGKSKMVAMLQDSGKMQLTCICPNAYEVKELYGSEKTNGIICSLIEELLRLLKNQPSRRRALFLDGQLGEWVQPLAGVLSSGHIIQPNGNTLLIHEQLKFIIECQSISSAPPSLALNAALIVINEPIKWQNLFSHYLAARISPKYRLPNLTRFLQLFIPYIVDPIIEFYESNCGEYKGSKAHCYIPPNCIILSLLQLSETFFDAHFIDRPIEQLSEKVCSDIFNLFVLAIIWTVGGSLPEQIRKSFSRHFKYLIKRAVQVNIQGVSRQSLPEEEQDLFKITYHNDRWVYWNQTFLHSSASSPKHIFLQRPEDIGLAYVIERYLNKTQSFFLLGVPSSQKVAFLDSVLARLSPEVYNIQRTNFNPNSKVSLLRNLILKEMGNSKYSHDFKGFVHGKKTVFFIRDLSMPLVKSESSYKSGLLEFIRHYYVTNGWYLKETARIFQFKSIIFCATVNIHQPLPENLLKHGNSGFRVSNKEELSSALTVLFNDSPLKPSIDIAVSLIGNLHHAVSRELSGISIVCFETGHAMRVAQALIRMGSCEKNELLRRWILLSQKVYQQQLMSDQSERLFYLINNVLMEEQKLRYKTIRPIPQKYEAYFPIHSSFTCVGIKQLRRQVERRCRDAIVGAKDKRQKKQSKILQFALELSYNVSELSRHLTPAKQLRFPCLKDTFVRLITHLYSTIQLEISYVLAISIESSFSYLDLQECLEIVAVLRSAKLVCIRVKDQSWNNKGDGTWKDIVLGLIEEILSSLERSDEIKQIIILITEFSSDNDYILDDLMDMKRLRILPFEKEVKIMLEYFLDHCKVGVAQRKEESSEDNWAYQSKAKMKERKYQMERKEREKRLRTLETSIIDRLKFVVSLTADSLQKVKKSKLIEEYSDELSEFSVLNLNNFSQKSSPERNWRTQHQQPSLTHLKSKTIITDLHDFQDLQSQVEQEEQSNDGSVCVGEGQELIIEHITQKMTSKYCFSPEDQWLRSKQASLKGLYSAVKERLLKLCHAKSQLFSMRIKKLLQLQELFLLIQSQSERVARQGQLIQQSMLKMSRQSQEREAEYEQAQNSNRNMERKLHELSSQKEELRLIYERAISITREQFERERERLLDVLRQCKDKKIVAVNVALRILFEALGVLVEKVVKPDQELYKEVIKDLQLGAAKISKKIVSLCSTGHFNVPERVLSKVKELLAEIERGKQERKLRLEQLEKEESIVGKLFRHLFAFCSRLLEFSNAASLKQVKECLRRMGENDRLMEKLRENQAKSLKSKQYLSILERYEEGKKKYLEFQKEKLKMKTIESICSKLKDKISKLSSIENGQNFQCGLGHAGCSYICSVVRGMEEARQKIKEIEEEIDSFALTVAITLYYKVETCQHQIENIVLDFERYRSSQANYNTIQFIPDQLDSLQTIGMFEQAASRNSKSKSEYTKLVQASRRFLQASSQQKHLLPLVQFSPGIFVMGASNNGSVTGTSVRESEWALKDFLVSSVQLAGWLRNRTGESYHKVCLSSRVILDGKGFPRSAKSIVLEENELEASAQRMGIVLVESRQELKSLMNVLRREPVGKDITVLLMVSNGSLPFEQRIFSLPAPNSEQNINLTKKIESLLLSYSDKAQASYLSQVAEANSQKQQSHLKIDYMLDNLNDQSLNQLFTALREENYEQLQRFHAFFRKSDKSSKDLGEGKASTSVKQLMTWIQQMVDDTQLLYRTFMRLEAIKNEQTDKRKSAGLSERITPFLARILCIILSLQGEGVLTKSLSAQRYMSMIGQILEHNKDLCKKNPIRAFSELKMLLWNLVAFLFPNHLSIVRFVFIVAQQQYLPYEDSTIAHVVTLIYRNSGEAIFEKSLLEEGTDYISLYFPQTIESEESQQVQQRKMSEKMKRKLKEVERYFDRHGLTLSFENNLKEWMSFAERIDSQTSKIPNYLVENSNILLVAYFLSIFNPCQLQKWVQNMDSEGYCKGQTSISSLSDAKRGEIKLSQGAYSHEWKQLANFIQYHLQVRSTNHLLLLEHAPLDIIESTSCLRIAQSYFDISTFLWQLQKLQEMKEAEEYEQVREIQQAPPEDGQREKELISLVQMYKNSLKNEGLVIVNLKHWVTQTISPIAYLQKIQILLSLLLQECPISNLYSLLKQNKNIKFSSRAIVVYTFDSDAECSNSLIDNFQGLKNSYVLFEPIKQTSQTQAPKKYLRTAYYQSIFKSGKNRRQYQRMPYSSKAILYSFLFLAERVLYEMRSDDQRILMEKITSKIEGCAAVIRQLSLLGDKQQQLLGRWCDWGTQRGWTELQQKELDCIVLRLEQYTLLVIEYCFELNYKTSLIDKRLRSTLEHLIELQDVRNTLPYLQLTQINNLLEEEISSYQQVGSQELLWKLWRFSEQGLALSLEEGQKEASFKEQEEKLIHVFLQESRLQFSEKIKEIEGFSLQSFNELRIFVERLRLYDIKHLYDLYRQLATSIESIHNLQARYAAASTKSNSSQAQSHTPNALITSAITDLFNKHASHRSESRHSEIAQLQEVLLSSLVTHKKKIISATGFLDELREVLKDFIEIELHKCQQSHSEELSEASDDEQQNIRQIEEQEIRSLIKKKIQMKILSERLIKKISSLRRKLGEPLHRSLTFKDQKVILEATGLAIQNYCLLQQESQDHLHNYQLFEREYKENLIGLSEGFEAGEAISRFTFNFNHHSLSTILHILRAHQSRRCHQQYHSITYRMTLLPNKKQLSSSATHCYFKGIKLFNASYSIRDGMITLQPSQGAITRCEDLLVRVAVMEESDDNSNEDGEASTIYRLPFYLRDQWGREESRLRIEVTISELLKFQLPNYNIYLTH